MQLALENSFEFIPEINTFMYRQGIYYNLIISIEAWSGSQIHHTLTN